MKAPFALCHKCPLQDRPFVPGNGATLKEAEFVFLGEAPGYKEAADKLPFVGPSGQLLRAVLDGVGIKNYYLTNTILCHPTGNQYNYRAAEACSKRLTEELRPYIEEGVPLVLLGKKAVEAVLPAQSAKKMNDIAGHWFKDGRVYVLHHPSYIMRVPALMPYYIYDVKRLTQGELAIPTIEYKHVRTADTLMDLLSELTEKVETIVVDVESRGLRWFEDDLLTVGIAWSETQAIVFDAELLENASVRYAFNYLLRNKTVVGHNYKFDLKMLHYQYGISLHDFEDSMIAHYALDENVSHGLKDLLWLYFGIEDYQKNMIDRYLSKKGDDWNKIPRDVLAHYNALDVCYNWMLWKRLKNDLIQERLYERPYRFPMMESQVPFTDIELQGIKIDIDRKKSLSKTFAEYLDKLYEKMKATSTGEDFNPASWQQISKIMYGYFDMPLVSGRGYKKGSTCAAARERIKTMLAEEDPGRQWLDLLEEYRTIDKLRGSYVDNLDNYMDAHGYVHPDFVVTGTEIGRLSARDPAIQTIPRSSSGEIGETAWGKEIKRMYVPEEGYVLMQSDYSQAEMRVAAALSEDPFLLKVYQEDRDLHSEVAEAMFGKDFTYEQRQICKSFNFAYLYGGTEQSFDTKGVLNAEDARRAVRRYKNILQTLDRWKEMQFRKAKQNGEVVSSFNRRRRFPLITSDTLDDIRKASGHMPIAGDASDLTLISLIKIWHWIENNGIDARIFATVHDSILLVVKKELVYKVGKKVKEIMEGTGGKYFGSVPWRCDLEIGENWGELEEVTLDDLSIRYSREE